jgi:hypothetical protein
MSGGSAGFGLSKYLTDKAPGARKNVDAIQVVVATQDIPRGAAFAAEMVTIRGTPW